MIFERRFRMRPHCDLIERQLKSAQEDLEFIRNNLTKAGLINTVAT
jgi:hypothetical protein